MVRRRGGPAAAGKSAGGPYNDETGAQRLQARTTGTMSRPKERRLHPRFSVDAPIELGGREGPALLRDLSMSGLSCVSKIAFEDMTVLEITMKLPHPDGQVPFKAGGAVVRCEEVEAGKHLVAVFFTQMDPANRKVLAEFIEAHSAR